MPPSVISRGSASDYNVTVPIYRKSKLGFASNTPDSASAADNRSLTSESTSLYTVPSRTTVATAQNSEKEEHTFNLPTDLSDNLAFNLQTAYQLAPQETNTSMDQYNLEVPDRYRFKLQFTKHEIEMLRYTWNKMLLEENKASSNMPGGFNSNNGPKRNVSKSSTAPRQTTTSSMASSLFCRQLYSNLLTLAPELELLWPSLRHQAVSFAQVMQMTIAHLEDLSVLDSFFEKLGKSHARIFGIEPPAYEIMGEALIQTFNERFGTRFTIELEVLWIKLFLYMANSILQFGLDPVLRLQRTESRQSSVSIVNQSSASASVLAADADINSVFERKSISTNATSVVEDLAQPPKIDGKPKSRFSSHRGSVSYNGDLGSVLEKKKHGEVQDPKKKSKLGRLKKKGDCVIM
ncbi:hypothetical protein CANMA_001546 [Candida margitis]|uniref:uncharacterized protein n=1 Tax=Candida margitis TaxID=1775924 RepID=UPI002226DF7B|nr:uncharacterized protein CANMA_001546 [Candida margitis]KAI5969478.1 hypothetical protein CANMA_001546 [Candida margitis]